MQEWQDKENVGCRFHPALPIVCDEGAWTPSVRVSHEQPAAQGKNLQMLLQTKMRKDRSRAGTAGWTWEAQWTTNGTCCIIVEMEAGQKENIKGDFTIRGDARTRS